MPFNNIIQDLSPGRKTLYVSDLDGTLLNTKDKISEISLSIINKLIDEGMDFTYATARSLSSASIVTKGLKLNYPLIVYNGAFTINPNTGEILYSIYFSSEEKKYISNLLSNHNIFPLVYSFIDKVEKVSWLVDKENDGVRRYIENRNGSKRLNPLLFQPDLYNGNNFYYTCIGEEEDLQPIYNTLKDNMNFNCILHRELYRDEFWCEIMPHKATKAFAIEKLKKNYNFKRLISFGDALNDIPMFNISDESYAVENSVPELKEISSGIIGSNDDDGVAIWLKNNFQCSLI
ncbi:MAG: HAD family hydrolase [Spirochaetales bacterium]|nr:HAD family hydrolase [Spirochaetales bacterium]